MTEVHEADLPCPEEEANASCDDETEENSSVRPPIALEPALRCLRDDILAVCVVEETLWMAARDGSVHVRSLATGHEIRAFPNKSSDLTGVVCCLHHVYRQVWGGLSTGVIRVWDVQGMEMVRDLPGHADWVDCLAVSDGKVWSGGADCQIRQWDAEGAPEGVLKGHAGAVRSLLVVDGKRLWSGADDACIRIWDIETGECLHEINTHDDTVQTLVAVRCHAVWSGSHDGTIRGWDASSFTTLRQATCRKGCGHTGEIMVLACVGAHVWSGGSDGKICVWDHDMCLVREMHAHHSSILALLRRSWCVWSVGTDKQLKAWIGEGYFGGEIDVHTMRRDFMETLANIRLIEERHTLFDAQQREAVDAMELRLKEASLEVKRVVGENRLLHEKVASLQNMLENRSKLSNIRGLLADAKGAAEESLLKAQKKASTIATLDEDDPRGIVLSAPITPRREEEGEEERQRNITLELKVAELQQKLQEKQAEAHQWEQTTQTRNEENSDLREEVQALKELNDELNSKIQAFSNSRNGTIHEDHAKTELLEAQLAAAREEVLHLQQQHEADVSVVPNLQHRVQTLEDELVSARSDNDLLQEELQTHREDVDGNPHALVEEENRVLREEVERLANNEPNDTENALLSEMALLQERLDVSENTRHIEAEEARDAVDRMKIENDLLLREVKDLQDQLKVAKALPPQDIPRMLQEQSIVVQDKEDDVDPDTELLRQQLIEFKDHCSKLEVENYRTTREMEQLREQLLKEQKERDRLKSKFGRKLLAQSPKRPGPVSTPPPPPVRQTRRRVDVHNTGAYTERIERRGPVASRERAERHKRLETKRDSHHLDERKGWHSALGALATPRFVSRRHHPHDRGPASDMNIRCKAAEEEMLERHASELKEIDTRLHHASEEDAVAHSLLTLRRRASHDLLQGDNASDEPLLDDVQAKAKKRLMRERTRLEKRHVYELGSLRKQIGGTRHHESENRESSVSIHTAPAAPAPEPELESELAPSEPVPPGPPTKIRPIIPPMKLGKLHSLESLKFQDVEASDEEINAVPSMPAPRFVAGKACLGPSKGLVRPIHPASVGSGGSTPPPSKLPGSPLLTFKPVGESVSDGELSSPSFFRPTLSALHRRQKTLDDHPPQGVPAESSSTPKQRRRS